MLDADDLLKEFEETKELSINESTREAYTKRYKNYLRIIPTIKGADPPEPITELNVKLFITQRQREKVLYNTIIAEIAAIGYFCRKNGWEDVTKADFIKEFKKGLARKQKIGTLPNATIPLEKSDLLAIIKVADLEERRDVEILAHAILQYYGILRINEVVNLKNSDFEFFENKVKVHIGKSKTDQIGVGRVVVIFRDSEVPFNIDILVKLYDANEPDSFYFKGKNGMHSSDTTLRKRFKEILKRAGISDEKLSTHSLRKGGAVKLAQNRVQAEAIQYQGGWKSTAFLRYTRFDEAKTEDAIINKF